MNRLRNKYRKMSWNGCMNISHRVNKKKMNNI